MSAVDEQLTLTQDDLMIIQNTALWLGAGAPKLSKLLTSQVIEAFAAYALQQNITPDGLIENFGTRPEDAEVMIELFGGPEYMAETVVLIADVLPLAPHPESTVIVLPLFIALTILTSIVLGLRLWSRHQVAGSIKGFDWLAVVGFLLTLVWGSVAVYHSDLNTGPSAFYDKSWHTLSKSYEAYFILIALYPFVVMTIKLSLLLFYWRMTTWKELRYSVLATGVIVVGNTIAAFLVWMFQCSHVDYWNHQFSLSCRINNQAFMLAMSGIYIATDVIIWVLPMPLVFQLKLYPRERLLAVITFSLGGIACIASCFRLDAVRRYTLYSEQSTSSLLIDAWTILELNLALICASAPAVRALAIHYAPKLLSSRATSPQPSFETKERIHSRQESITSERSTNSHLKLGLETQVTAEPGKFQQVEIMYDRSQEASPTRMV